MGWDVPDIDLDTVSEASFGGLLDRDRPEVVIHTAAWTDVDGCAKDPALAMRRNGTAVGEIANACAARGIDLVFISTNEVFDGTRTDGIGYAPGDERNPVNPYGAAKAERRSGSRSRPTRRPGHGAGPASSGPRGCTVRPATTSRPRSRPRRSARAPRARRCGPSRTRSVFPPTRRTSPRPSSS